MREKLLRWAPWILALAAALVLGRRAETAFAAQQVQWGHDLAFFTQIFHNAAHGRAWTSPLLLEPVGFFRMVHFHPVIAALLPLWMLRPSPSTLLWFNVLAACLAAVPLAGLARDRSGSVAFGAAAAVAWLVWLPVQAAALADFRPSVFFLPGFLLLLWGAARPCRWRLLAGALLVCATREESSYLLVLVGLVLAALPFGKRRRGDGLLLAGLGAAWFVFLLIFKENFFFHFNPVSFFENLGGGAAPAAELTRSRLLHLGLLFCGGFGACLICPAALLMLLPPMAFLLLDPAREWHAFTGTYPYFRHVLLPFLGAGGVLGWAWMLKARPWRRPREALVLVTLAMVLGNALAFFGARQRMDEGIWQRNVELAQSQEVRALDGLLAQVPPEARVATDYQLVASLAGRRVLWCVAHMYMDGMPHDWQGEWPITLDWVDTLLVAEDEPIVQRLDDDWELADRAAGYGLWHRVRDPQGGFPPAIP